MKAKIVIGEALKHLGLTNFFNLEEITNDQQATIDKLLLCLNVTLREIACEYSPIYDNVTFESDNGKILYSDFTHMPLHVLKVTKSGANVSFSEEPTQLDVKCSGRFEIKYTFVPENITVEDDICDQRLPLDVLVNGVLSHYYFIDRMFDYSEAYDIKFRDGIFKFCTGKKERIMTVRRWA